MSLSDEERMTIVGLEIDKARRMYNQALMMQQVEQWDAMANRLYYALFHAVCALLIRDRHVVNTHKGSHALFAQYYIKNASCRNNMASCIKKWNECVKKATTTVRMTKNPMCFRPTLPLRK